MRMERARESDVEQPENECPMSEPAREGMCALIKFENRL